jgi:hypothetical protein
MPLANRLFQFDSASVKFLLDNIPLLMCRMTHLCLQNVDLVM